MTSSELASDLVARARELRWLLFDVDGVLCERLWFDGDGEMLKPFDVKDGFAIRAAASVGLSIGLLTARSSRAVERRAADLGFDAVMTGSGDKAASFGAFLEQYGLEPSQVAYIGDDLPDLPVLRRCGLSFAPADAAREVRERVDRVLRTPGGQGAVREMVETVLEARDEWRLVVERYLG